MRVKNGVFIFAKRIDDSIRLLGVKDEYETKGYQIARTLQSEFAENKITTQIKDLEIYNTETDVQILKTIRMLIIIATEKNHLSVGKQIAEKVKKEINPKLEYVFFVTLENNAESVNRKDICCDSVPSKFVQISKEHPIREFVDKVCYYLSSDSMEKSVTIPKELKESYLIGQPFARFAENVTPRKWLDKELQAWVTNSKSQRFFWLCGEHGSGKTVFIGDYFKRLTNIIGKGIYYCRYSSVQNQSVEHIVKSIVYSICECVPGYLNIISRFGDEFFKNSDFDRLVTSLLISPFNEKFDIYPIGKFVFVIDGIDELKSDVLKTFLELLRNYSDSLPKFISIIVTSTSMENINSTMRALPVKSVDLAADRFILHKKADAKRFLTNELDDLGIKCSENEINNILLKAEWNFDYLHHFLAQCEERGNDFLLTDELPIGLTAMFESDFGQRFPEDFFNAQIKPILEVIVASKEPLSVEDLSQILSLGINKLQSIIKGVLKQFLAFSEGHEIEKVSLYNKSFQLWLIQKNHKFCVDMKHGNQIIVDWMKGKPNYLFENLYLRKYGIIHILEAEDSDEINVIAEKIEKSDEDDFETLKMLLSKAYLSVLQNGQSAQMSLIQIYRSKYSGCVARYRDLLIYTYRYVLKRKGNDAAKLDDIYQVLFENHEEIRAKLLKGEGITNYDLAKNHFMATIECAKKYINNTNSADQWWNTRMLGTAYNRLANLEKKHGDIDEAEKQYKHGKNCFDKAEQLLSKTGMAEEFLDDMIIIHRDKAIINERLGDISFAKHIFLDAKNYYQIYYKACEKAFKNRSTLRNKWDLSISLLRLGDALRYLGQLKKAQTHYRRSLNLRRDILLEMHSEYASMVLNIDYYLEFECFDIQADSNIFVDEVPRESRDIDPVRDLAMCYVRLGDLAFFIRDIDTARFFYGKFYDLCQYNNNVFNTEASIKEFKLSQERLNRLSSKE
ncbi:MAG: tetratricopeptide repeat protein [Lachnospiraceae bacterium]|nr:tetratricopeptide repeat protein [Lachnospiraceae bacterium]